jgi:hypothetical protein
MHVFFIPDEFIKIACCTVAAFFGKDAPDISPGESACYGPTRSSSVLPSMDLVKSLLSGNGTNPKLLCMDPSGPSAA